MNASRQRWFASGDTLHTMTISKRLFDLIFALILALILCPILIIIFLWILVAEGRPVFYVAERMKTPSDAFQMIKFRTMRPALGDSGASGGHKSERITRSGRFLRATRLDELPQLWNVITGDISFVGPRPPLRLYVESFPNIYNQVLKSRPGITGLASLKFSAHEQRLLEHCKTNEETELIYRSVCVPRKAKLDLIYQSNRNFCFDLILVVKTALRALGVG